MSIEQPVHQRGLPRQPADRWAPRPSAYPHRTAPRPTTRPGYPAPQLLGGRPLHPATPPAGLAVPVAWPAPVVPAPSRGPAVGGSFRGSAGPSGGGLAVVGVVCGAVALLVSWVPWVSVAALALAALGVLCGVLALHRRAGRRGLGVAAVTTSGLALATAVVTSVLCLFGIAARVEATRELGTPTVPTSAALPSRGVSNDTPSADRVFLQLLRSQDIAIGDTQALRVGRAVCGSWVDGADLYAQASAVRPAGLGDFDTGFLIGVATRVYCPAYQSRLRG